MRPVRLLLLSALTSLVVLLLGSALSDGQSLSRPVSNADSDTPPIMPPALSTAVTGTLAFVQVYTYSMAPYFSEHIATADFDRDGRTDVIIAETLYPTYASRLVLLRNLGNWQFSATPVVTYSAAGSYLYQVQAADLNNDQWPDLVLRRHCDINVLLSDHIGGFTPSWIGSDGWNYCGSGLALADMNGDGADDILAGQQPGGGGSIDLFTNNGLGTVFTRTWHSRHFGDPNAGDFRSVVPTRLNQDSLADIVGGEIYDGVLVTFLGDGTGITFTQVMSAEVGSRIFGMAGGNLDGDGLTDIVLSSHDALRAYTAQGGGVLSDTWNNTSLPFGYVQTLRDFNHDGYDDLFNGSFETGQMAVYLNQLPSGTLQLAWTSKLPSELYSGTVDDLDGDGNLDLIVGEKSVLHMYRLVFMTQHYFFPVVFRN